MADPIVPWMGGKRRMADKILPMIPKHTCYVEPFAGAAAILFAKEPSKCEVLNDLNGELVNLYRVVQHHLEELVRQFKWALTSRQIYNWLSDTPPETLTDIQRAARFFYIQTHTFGSKPATRAFGTKTSGRAQLNLLRLEEKLSAAHLRLHGVFVESMDWKDLVKRYDREHTVFFMDPPYLDVVGYGIVWRKQDFEEMSEIVRSIKGRAIITVSNVPEMKKVFKGLRIKQVTTPYTIRHAGRTIGRELIIRNW